MALRNALRTIDLARAAGISVQQVRNYEASGLLPPALRSKSGYRLDTQHHLAALKTARSLVGGYGWQRTPTIMQALHRADLGVALATIDTRHDELVAGRPEKAIVAVEKRREELTSTSWVCIEALAYFQRYVRELTVSSTTCK